MANNEYELTDEQWEQIKDLFPVANTGRPGKDNRIMFNAMIWIARQELNGVSFLNIMVRGKLFTADSVNGVMMEHCGRFLKFYAKIAIWKI